MTNKDKHNKQLNKIISGESIMKEINNQNITLLPFTFDDHGAMGPLANKYFNNTKTTPTITNKKELNSFTKEGLIAYNRGRSNNKFISLFKRANKGWKNIKKTGLELPISLSTHQSGVGTI